MIKIVILCHDIHSRKGSLLFSQVNPSSRRMIWSKALLPSFVFPQRHLSSASLTSPPSVHHQLHASVTVLSVLTWTRTQTLISFLQEHVSSTWMDYPAHANACVYIRLFVCVCMSAVLMFWPSKNKCDSAISCGHCVCLLTGDAVFLQDDSVSNECLFDLQHQKSKQSFELNFITIFTCQHKNVSQLTIVFKML